MMIKSGALSIRAHSMLTAVGLDGQSTCAAMRAGISGVATANLWDYTEGQHLNAGRPKMLQWWEGATMLPELLVQPLEECRSLLSPEHYDTSPIFVLLPPPGRPYRPPDLEKIVLGGLCVKLGGALPPGSRAFENGRAGIAPALEEAAQHAQVGRSCIIVGAESFLRQVLVEHYIENQRLLCSINSNGFIPGEAACAILIGPSRTTRGPELIIEGLGIGYEPAGTGGDEKISVRGDGLTEAVRNALQQAGLEHSMLEYTISDLNGERFKFKETTIYQARLDRLRPPGTPSRKQGYLDMWQPIQFLGEIGAAVFPCMLGWALHASQRGYAPSLHCLLHASEDNGQRVAVVTRYQSGVQD